MLLEDLNLKDFSGKYQDRLSLIGISAESLKVAVGIVSHQEKAPNDAHASLAADFVQAIDPYLSDIAHVTRTAMATHKCIVDYASKLYQVRNNVCSYMHFIIGHKLDVTKAAVCQGNQDIKQLMGYDEAYDLIDDVIRHTYEISIDMTIEQAIGDWDKTIAQRVADRLYTEGKLDNKYHVKLCNATLDNLRDFCENAHVHSEKFTSSEESRQVLKHVYADAFKLTPKDAGTLLSIIDEMVK